MPEPALSGSEFKKQLHQGTPKVGLFLNSHSPTVAEQIAHSGYDWLLVDTQHGPMDHEKLSAMLCGIANGGANFPVYPRQMAHIIGTDRISQEITPVAPPDGFDSWCRERERREESMTSVRYVPRDMIGYEDLDTYGVWRNVPPYGWVWTPANVAVGWAPYHDGHWAWVEPWGWTWIDDAPWGFAPFHYGRWAFAGGAWVWAPGRLDPAVRPVYAPALVAFVRVGHVSVTAWFPLGPGEVYRPAYAVSAVYVRRT